MDSFVLSVAVLLFSILGCFIAGLMTRNYSHVDRLWSVLPPVYAGIWFSDFYTNPRFVLAAVLVIAWGIRLTWNFSRRGGYAFSFSEGFTGEDYRWPILREKINNRVLFELFNLFFISAFQLTLIFFFTLPLYYIGVCDSPLGLGDTVLLGFQLVFLLIETVSDNQQFRFHERKNQVPWKENPRYRLGFNTFGLWRFSRHPNYVGEIGQWAVLYLLLFMCEGSLSWKVSGVAVLILLFAGSTRMTETLTASKYPAYGQWRKATSPWLPFVDVVFRLKARKKFWNQIND